MGLSRAEIRTKWSMTTSGLKPRMTSMGFFSVMATVSPNPKKKKKNIFFFFFFFFFFFYTKKKKKKKKKKTPPPPPKKKCEQMDGKPFLLEGKGGRMNVRILHVFTFRDGRILVGSRLWLDLAAIQRQLV